MIVLGHSPCGLDSHGTGRENVECHEVGHIALIVGVDGWKVD